MNELLEFLQKYSDALPFLVGGGSLAGVAAAAVKAVRWYLARRYRSEKASPFDIVKPGGEVEKLLLGGDDDDALAARNVPYQARRSGRVVRDEIEGLFAQKQGVLILGRKGIGKTREAVELVASLNREGWTVLNLRRPITAPGALTEEALGTNRKLLFFFDDLNRRMYGSPRELPPGSSEILPVRIMPLQEGLLRTLEAFERIFGRDEIRLVATARDEREPEYADEPSAWDKLQVDGYPALWSRFAFYRLPEPEDRMVAELLKQAAAEAGVTVEADQYWQLAQRNDQTLLNVVENLRRAKNRGGVLRLAEFQDTLKGTWRQRYEDAVKRFPAAREIYDAIDLLQSVQVEPTEATVRMLASRLPRLNPLERIGRRFAVRAALHHLARAEHLLRPRDGQIEAKGYRMDVRQNLPALAAVLSANPGSVSAGSLSHFALISMAAGQYRCAAGMLRKYLRLKPQDGEAWYWLGRAQAGLGKTAEAVASFTAALSHDPTLYWAALDRGDAEVKLGRLDSALASYEGAIQVQPHDHQVWVRRGRVELRLGHDEDALASFEKALEFEVTDEAVSGRDEALSRLGRAPEPATASEPADGDFAGWFSRANVERLAKRPAAALPAYTKAIAAKPDYAEAWFGKGIAHADLEQYAEAVGCYRKALELKPGLSWAHYDWGNAERARGNHRAALEQYRAAIALRRDYAKAWQGLGLAYAALGESDDAFEAYDQALAADPALHWVHFNRAELLRATGRLDEAIAEYDAAIAAQREYPRAWWGRGLALAALKRHDEAVASLATAMPMTDSPDLPFDLARVERARGRPREALQHLELVTALERPPAEAWYERATCEALLGERAGALESLRAAVKLDPVLARRAADDPALAELARELSAARKAAAARGPKRPARTQKPSKRP